MKVLINVQISKVKLLKMIGIKVLGSGNIGTWSVKIIEDKGP